MNMRTRLKRATIAAMVVLVIFGAGAFAQDAQTSAPVSVAVVNGQRTLGVTGSLAFGAGTTTGSLPFTVTVQDVAHEDVGYQVSAVLTDLYKLDGSTDATPGVDCSAAIDSSRFQVSFGGAADPAISGVEALVDSTLQFTGDLETDTTGLDLSALDLGLVDTTITPTVQTLLNNVVTSALLMDVQNGATDDFQSSQSDGVCDTSGTSGYPVLIQDATAQDPLSGELATIQQDIFDAADGTTGDDVLTAAEAANDQLLSATADQPGGVLYEATKTAIEEFLADNPLAIVTTTIDDVTADLVASITATIDDLTSSVDGQTGIYANTPNLELLGTGTATTGVYKGTMTLTLTDK